MSSGLKGELAVLRVLMRAVEKGWIASRPTRECRYDLILDDGNILYRVQVKYCNRRATNADGAVCLDLTKGGARKPRPYLDKEIDALVVYVVPVDALIWVGADIFHGKRHLQIRYTPTKSGQKKGTFMTDDYLWLWRTGREGRRFKSDQPD